MRLTRETGSCNGSPFFMFSVIDFQAFVESSELRLLLQQIRNRFVYHNNAMR
jgi:hypothetical protein